MIKLNEKKWKAFFILDVASISSGRNITKSKRISGPFPYISSTSRNNGIIDFVSCEGPFVESACLSVNRNGSVGYSFFHNYKAVFSGDTKILKLKCPSVFVGYFVAHQIMQQKDKYSYGYKLGTARLQKQKIMLPITASGKPDYEFMSQYIQNIMYKKYKQFLDFLGALRKL